MLSGEGDNLAISVAASAAIHIRGRDSENKEREVSGIKAKKKI